MSYALNGKTVDMPLTECSQNEVDAIDIKEVKDIIIHGKILDCDNNPVPCAIVGVFYEENNNIIPICHTFTGCDGEYMININYDDYKGKTITVKAVKTNCPPSCQCDINKIKCDINIKEVKDIIIYGKVLNCDGSPVGGAIVTAFYEQGDKMIAICHSFTGCDGVYMMNIDYDIYKGKKIIVRSVKTNSSPQCKCP